MRQWISRFILRLLGWTPVDLPQRPERAVLVVYPHTSNWDFPLGVLFKAAVGLNVRWAGKDTLFRGPMGPFMRWLGGIAINRREPAGIVERLAAALEREPFLLAITPEGTRSLRPGWKSGFYRIARRTGLPVVLGTIDYGGRRVGLIDCFQLSGDEDADMARIAACFRDCRGRRPALASPIRLL
ncbi:MAG TPA: 1-acyl-sn-glycerol-3-phosphate acyltransferase [Rhodocyclaceae bacterium]|nr:1-acyl-sn-glycerol-3-phosphate acyltransferase [Rhodocyclaceae bacterium]